MNKILNLISEYFVHLITNVPTLIIITIENIKIIQKFSQILHPMRWITFITVIKIWCPKQSEKTFLKSLFSH